NGVVPGAELEGYVKKFAATIGGNAPLTIRAAKMAINAAVENPQRRRMAEIDAAIKACFARDDYIEGRRAFMEKRNPALKGRQTPAPRSTPPPSPSARPLRHC